MNFTSVATPAPIVASSEALKESYTLYRTRVADIFLTRILAFLQKLMDDVWMQCAHANELDKHLMQFQNALVGVSRWSRIALEKERDILVQHADMDDLNATISCLLVLQAKLLSYVCPGQNKHAITIDLPDDCTFLHHIYIACARTAWRNARLFHRRTDSVMQQHNDTEVRRILRECIHDCIDKYVPMKDIQRALLDKHEEARTEVTTTTTTTTTPTAAAPATAALPLVPQEPLLSWGGSPHPAPLPSIVPPAPAAFAPAPAPAPAPPLPTSSTVLTELPFVSDIGGGMTWSAPTTPLPTFELPSTFHNAPLTSLDLSQFSM